MNNLHRVKEFHDKFNVNVLDSPEHISKERAKLRFDLLREELNELENAYYTDGPQEILKEISDLQYILDGTYLEFGLWPYKDAALAEVHRSNMSKLDDDGRPIVRSDGKILKSKNYIPADMSKILE